MNISITWYKDLRNDGLAHDQSLAAKQKIKGNAVFSAACRMSFALLIAAMPLTAINLITPSAYGQASSSSAAVGKVTDASGATISGATVHLTNNATGAERTATTNDSGDWSIPNLPPANYRVRIEKQGFKTAQLPSLDVEIGKTANGSVTMTIGERTETVEVSTLPPQLQTQEATVGQVINQKQINDLPLNGRNVLQLATLAPGVSPPQTGQTGMCRVLLRRPPKRELRRRRSERDPTSRRAAPAAHATSARRQPASPPARSIAASAPRASYVRRSAGYPSRAIVARISSQ